jgi:hypothetical protein
MKWIVAAFVFFALFIGTLVFISMRQDIGLVSKNYYQDELKHSEKMAKQENASQLSEQPQMTFENNSVKIVYPLFSTIESGELKVQRPSDERLDQQFEISAGGGDSQSFELKVWEKGLYRVSLTLTMEGKEYYFEKLMVL